MVPFLFPAFTGGVMAMQVSIINEYSGIVAFTGTGELNVLGGKKGKRECVH